MPDQSPNAARDMLPPQTRSAPVATVNAEARTVDLVWTTGASVRRYDWRRDRYYTESLEVTPEAVDLSRLQSGAPLLNAHWSMSLEDIVGVVEAARIEDGVGYATVRFSERPELEGIWRDVQSGVIRNVSVGYRIDKLAMEQDESGNWTYRATGWTPLEISLVPVGADPDCGTRNEPGSDDSRHRQYPVELTESRFNTPSAAADTHIREEPMSKETQAPAADTVDQASVDAARSDATTAERQRAADIRANVRAAGLDDATADDLVARGVPTADANAEIIQALAARSQQSQQRGQNVQVSGGETEVRRQLMGEALAHRADPRRELSDAARHYRGMSLIDMARECVEAAGGNVRGMTSFEIAGVALNMQRAPGMHSSSDFSLITASVLNRSLRDHYDAAGQTFWPLVSRTTATDFRDKYIVRMGGAAKLEKVGEGGEYKYGTLKDSGEKYAIETYGKIIAITRKTLINDDLDAFSRLPRFLAQEAADLESDLVWGLITGNPVMADGKKLFHAAHNNIAAGAVIGEAGLSAMRQLLALQKNESDKPMNLMGQYLLSPVAQMTAVQKLLAAVTAAKTGDVNVFQNAYTPIFEARLDAASADGYYLAAGPGRTDTIEVAYLEGQEGLYTETREGFDVDGIEVKARLDIGVGLGDYRWITLNPGSPAQTTP